MLIGELSKKTGFSRDAIRFYEKKGLIEVGWRQRRENNYKEYSQEVLNRLLAIKRLKSMGFTLNEVDELLDLIGVDLASCETVTEKMKGKVEDVERKIRELSELRELLKKQLNNKGPACDSEREGNCPELEREIVGGREG